MGKTKTGADRGKKEKKAGYGQRLILVGMCICGLLVGGVYGGRAAWKRVRTMPLFHCRKIQVTGNALLPTEHIMAQVTLDTSTSIFCYDIRSISQRVSQHPYVKTCVVKRWPPSTLVIQITERVPLAGLRLKELYLVDEEKVLLPQPEQGIGFDLPVITGLKLERTEVGSPLSTPGLDTAFDFIRALTGYNPVLLDGVSEIDVTAGRVTVLTTRPAVRIRLGSDFSEEKLMKWDILDQYHGEQLSNLEYVDLRFKDQIIIKKRT